MHIMTHDGWKPLGGPITSKLRNKYDCIMHGTDYHGNIMEHVDEHHNTVYTAYSFYTDETLTSHAFTAVKHWLCLIHLRLRKKDQGDPKMYSPTPEELRAIYR